MRYPDSETIVFDEPVKRARGGAEIKIDEQRVIFRAGIARKADIVLTHPAPFVRVFHGIGAKAMLDLRSEVGWAEVHDMDSRSYLRMGAGAVSLSGEIERGSELVHAAEFYRAKDIKGLQHLNVTFKSYAGSPDYRARGLDSEPIYKPNENGVIDFTALWDQGIRPDTFYLPQRLDI
ncbi:MAG TPA: hypothetical protein VF733_06690 [Candidatus Saccharimonadales bacterium]